jgi:DNA-binding transcriptional LysR family regulator
LDGLPEKPGHAAGLASLKLIHLDEPNRPCPNWAAWFGAFDLPCKDQGAGLRLNDYALAVMAAIEGQGVILGWAHLIDPLVAAGTLVQAAPERWETGVDFMLVWTGGLSEQATAVRNWLLSHPT